VEPEAQRGAGCTGREPAGHYSQHSHYSDPGRNGDLLQAVAPEVPAVCAVAQNTIAHYRAASVPLPESSNDDINARWLSRILDVDQERHGVPLQHERAEAERVQGCCRDHTLLAVGILRQHSIPARSRVGFATYLHPGARVDHVVAEAWIGHRWVRFDPGIAGPRGRVDDPFDIPIGDASPFLTAAAAWAGFRQLGASVDDLGVQIGPVAFTGAPFVLAYLIMDVAHRFGDELLLWDHWGAMPLPGGTLDTELGDHLADLVLRADTSDRSAEDELRDIHATDPRVRPGPQILQFSPRHEPPRQIRLDSPRTLGERADPSLSAPPDDGRSGGAPHDGRST
jgi:hypothetical protein